MWQAQVTSRDVKRHHCHNSSDLVKLENNKEITAKNRKSIIPVIKTYTEVMTFLGHANQETNSINRTNIAVITKRLISSSKVCANNF